MHECLFCKHFFYLILPAEEFVNLICPEYIDWRKNTIKKRKVYRLMLKCPFFPSSLYWVNDLMVAWWQEHDCYFTCWGFLFWFGGFFWVYKNKVLQFVNAHHLGNRVVGSVNCQVRNVGKKWRLFLKSSQLNPLVWLSSVPLKCFLVTWDL